MPSTTVMNIHRSMKSHVTMLLRRQAPCPRNRQSRPCVKTVRAAGRSQLPRSSPTVKRLLEQLRLLMSPLAWSRDGCCVAQDALESTRAEQLALSGQLLGHVRSAIQSPCANYVLQKCVEVLPPAHRQFVVDELQRDVCLHSGRCAG